jgi:hypothetical protein
MSSIEISNLSPAGSQLFQDTESFLDELTDQELGEIEGGFPRFYRYLTRWTIRSPRIVTKFRSKFVRGNLMGITHTAKTLVSMD